MLICLVRVAAVWKVKGKRPLCSYCCWRCMTEHVWHANAAFWLWHPGQQQQPLTRHWWAHQQLCVLQLNCNNLNTIAFFIISVNTAVVCYFRKKQVVRSNTNGASPFGWSNYLRLKTPHGFLKHPHDVNERVLLAREFVPKYWAFQGRSSNYLLN